VPLDDTLAELRDPVLFPDLSPTDKSGASGTPHLSKDAVAEQSTDDPRTRINRLRVPTIYPPVAQSYFTVVALLTPWSAGTPGLQIAAALVAIAVSWLLTVTPDGPHCGVGHRSLPSSRQRRPRRCPRRPAHRSRRRHHRKTPQARRSPPRRRSRREAPPTPPGPCLPHPSAGHCRQHLPRAYVPHVLAIGTLILGLVPGYLVEEGFDDGSSRSAILALLLPPEVRRLAAAVLAIALAAGLPSHETRPDRRHLLLAVRRCAPHRHPHLPLVRPPADRPRRPGPTSRVARRTPRVVRELRARDPAGPDLPRGRSHCGRRDHDSSPNHCGFTFDGPCVTCQHCPA
jgi:hypothetical protein